MLDAKRAAESPASSARFVGWRFVVQDSTCLQEQTVKLQ
jgi:hypothetical protein